MTWTRGFRWGLLCVLAVIAVFATTASGGEYNLKMLPEIGRCIKTGKGGEYRGGRCSRSEPGTGTWSWFSGPGEKAKFTGVVKEPFRIEPSGVANGAITCAPGEIEGEYTGPKNLTVKKLVMHSCGSAEGPCENKAGSTSGEVSFQELSGELGFVSHPKKLKVGWDLRPKSGSNLASFECGGEIVGGKSTGTGASRELQGSVIGHIEPVDHPVTKTLTLIEEIKKGVQFPTKFEGSPSDTLTLQIGEKFPGMGKTAHPATLQTRIALAGETALEVLGKCVGVGC